MWASANPAADECKTRPKPMQESASLPRIPVVEQRFISMDKQKKNSEQAVEVGHSRTRWLGCLAGTMAVAEAKCGDRRGDDGVAPACG